VISALIPIGIRHALETEVAPKLWEYVAGWIDGPANTNGVEPSS
jgi:hypothetical protein